MDSEGIGPASDVRRIERPAIKHAAQERDVQRQRIAELEKQVAELTKVGSLLQAIIENNAAHPNEYQALQLRIRARIAFLEAALIPESKHYRKFPNDLGADSYRLAQEQNSIVVAELRALLDEEEAG